MLERPLVSIDLEATGVDPVRDRIIELGVTVLRPDGTRKVFCQRYNPDMHIPEESTAIHGITDADVAVCPRFETQASAIHRALAGKDIVGYNLWRLDLPMLDEEFRRCGLGLELDGVRVIDAFAIFSKKEPRKLEDAVRRYCHREHDGAHGAGADAAATLDVLLGQIEEYRDLREMGLDKLAEYALIGDMKYVDFAHKLYRDEDGDVCFAFGPQKGAKLKDRTDFGNWMLRRDFPGNTLDIVRAELEKIFNSLGGAQ